LDDAGHVGYVVGGSVRDFLLGREVEVKDHDIATDALPDELCRLFPDALTVGKAFGVIKVPIESSVVLEIATFREDIGHANHRHPNQVRFTGPDQDARRRDFTINALFYDAKAGRILDFTDGLVDLKAGVVRAIGEPRLRFEEDALRLLRAVRFTANLGFALDPATAAAVTERAPLVAKVSAERVRDELTLMWTGPRPAEALELLSKLGLLKHLLPEIEALKEVGPELWAHTLKLLRCAVSQRAPGEPKRAALGWAILLHDVGKPGIARKALAAGGARPTTFNGHEIEGAKLVGAIGRRLKLPRAEADRAAKLVEEHIRFREVFKMREATLQRWAREEHFEDLLRLHRADATITDGNLAYHDFCLAKLREVRETAGEPHLIDGKDLIQLGFQPGPEFTRILRTVEDLAMERALTTKEQALEYVIKHFVG
jgi:poly(A) polymerase